MNKEVRGRRSFRKEIEERFSYKLSWIRMSWQPGYRNEVDALGLE